MTSRTRTARPGGSRLTQVIGAAVAAGTIALGVAVVAQGPLSVSTSAGGVSPSARAAAIPECDASLAVAAALAALPVPPMAPRRGVVPGGAGTSIPGVRSKAAALASATRSLDLRELLQNVADDAAAHELGLRSHDIDRQRDTALALRGVAAGVRRLCTGRPG